MAKTSGSDKLEADVVLEYAAAHDPVIRALVKGDTHERLVIQADGTTLTGSGSVAPTTPSGASGAITLVDLDWVHAADLLGGVQEVYTPTLHQFVQLTFGTDGYVASDGDMVLQVLFYADYDGALFFHHTQAGARAGDIQSGMSPGWVVRFADPIPAFLTTNTSGLFIFGRGAAWAANHVYAAPAPVPGSSVVHSIDATSSVTESGHLWSSSGAGTSGGSKPDFAGNIGGTVTDNDITWTDEGAIPTVGSLHLYALVS